MSHVRGKNTFVEVVEDDEEDDQGAMTKTQSVPAHVYSAYQRRVQEEEDEEDSGDSRREIFLVKGGGYDVQDEEDLWR